MRSPSRGPIFVPKYCFKIFLRPYKAIAWLLELLDLLSVFLDLEKIILPLKKKKEEEEEEKKVTTFQ